MAFLPWWNRRTTRHQQALKRVRALRSQCSPSAVDVSPAAVNRRGGVRLLSLDGGFNSGVVQLAYLKALEEEAKRPIHELFDVIVGTGTGGLLAILLGLEQYRLESVEKLFEILCEDVFGNPLENLLYHLDERKQGLSKADTKLLREIYQTLIGHADPAGHKTMLSYTQTPHVAVTGAQGIKPGLISNFDAPSIGGDAWPVWEAMRVATAMPTHFAPHYRGELAYHDASILEPNPAMQAYLCARRIYSGENDAPILVLVSIGTGANDPDGSIAERDIVTASEIAAQEMASFRKENKVHFGSYFRLNMREIPSVNLAACDLSYLELLRTLASEHINHDEYLRARQILVKCLAGRL